MTAIDYPDGTICEELSQYQPSIIMVKLPDDRHCVYIGDITNRDDWRYLTYDQWRDIGDFMGWQSNG